MKATRKPRRRLKAPPLGKTPSRGLATLAALGLAAIPLLSPQAARAQGYTYYTFDAPGAGDTFALGINNGGQIVGGYDYGADIGAVIQSGFTVAAASATSAAFSLSDITTHGVGAVSEFDGINNAGQVLGDYTTEDDLRDGTGADVGFLLDGLGHDDFLPDGYAGVGPGGINDSVVVSGYAIDQNGVSHGFVRSASGAYTTLDDPSADSNGTYVGGLNNAGTVVGNYRDAATGVRTAFVYQDGVFSVLPALAGDYSSAIGINNVGDIVGYYRTPNSTGGFSGTNKQGFVLTAGGALLTVDVPGADNTFVQAINDSGDVVGEYYSDSDPNGRLHAFLAIPNAAPEPSQLAALGLGALGLGGLALRARRRNTVA